MNRKPLTPLSLRTLLAALFVLLWPLARAAEISVVFSRFTPPYVLDDGGGINVDIVRESLVHEGYQVNAIYLPLTRALDMFAEKRVDGTALIAESSGVKAHYSREFVQYHNRAFALKARKLDIRSMADLKDKNIVAFQQASKYLGPHFGQVVGDNPNYKEMANQEQQTLMLLLGRIDVAIMEDKIFRFYREKLIAEGRVPRSVEWEVFDLFEPNSYKTAFIDPKVRDDFNRGLAAIRRNGQYDAIYRRYIDRYFAAKP